MTVNPQSYRDALAKTDPTVFNALLGEEQRQRDGVEMIPSENYAVPEVLALLVNVEVRLVVNRPLECRASASNV